MRSILCKAIVLGLLTACVLSSTRASAATGKEGTMHSSVPMNVPRMTNPCDDLVKECFAYVSEQFTTCLRASSSHPFCARSSIGELITHRWQIAPSSPELDAAPALTGPRLINRECLDKFDSQLSAHLGTETLTHDVIVMLGKLLASCQQDPSNELLRP
ncbi:MAG: hypothetical protein EBZ48_10240 [Proteobacteria bacterium]|nr:hypothetical protein [Pseudomonadota bacterium]